MAPVCKFWQQGFCRNGDSCRFEHPGGNRQNNNRSGQDSRRRDDQDRERPYALRVDTIKTDLSNEQPQWILSAFGPGFRAPAQLFGGLPREQSFEEMRLRHYELAAQGQVQQAVQEAQSMHNTAADQMRVALQDINGAIEYIISAEKSHPNRVDICNQSSQGGNSGVFSRGAQQPPQGFNKGPAPAFGQPTMGAPPNPFARAKSSFGAPASPGMRDVEVGPAQNQTQPNPFAAASLSQPPQNPFAKARAAFGQPQAGGFGQPAAGGFDKPSGFGAPSGGFNAPSAGLASAPAPGGFAKPSAFGNPQSANQGFSNSSTGGFSAQPSGGFASLAGNSFNGSSGFQNNQPSTGSGWGGNSNGSSASNPFAANGVAQSSITQPSGGAQPSVQRDGSGRIQSWGGKPVSYPDGQNEPCVRRADGQWERIWFPDGEPARTMAQEIPAECYDESLEQDYKYLREHGEFKNGVIPRYPPKWEWTSWDF